jgi:hypothetical protein
MLLMSDIKLKQMETKAIAGLRQATAIMMHQRTGTRQTIQKIRNLTMTEKYRRELKALLAIQWRALRRNEWHSTGERHE